MWAAEAGSRAASSANAGGHRWQLWELIISVPEHGMEPGMLAVRARATDLAGRTQPERAEWNRLGYGNNAIHQVDVRIV